MQLPSFRYHPDPISTGSVAPSDAECVCCGQRRGYIYVGPVYATEELVDCVCPWCIADGTAHDRLDAEFTDVACIGEERPDAAVARAIVDEVAFRTPGFHGWQQERWLTCCGDAAAFLGRAGHFELDRYPPGVAEAIRADTGIADDADWQNFRDALDSSGSPTAYVFRCLHCGRHLGYADCD